VNAPIVDVVGVIPPKRENPNIKEYKIDPAKFQSQIDEKHVNKVLKLPQDAIENKIEGSFDQLGRQKWVPKPGVWIAREKHKRADDRVQGVWVDPDASVIPRGIKKTEEGMKRQEIELMFKEDERSQIIRLQDKMHAPPLYRPGQSVHHFWASWFPTAPSWPARIGGKSGCARPEWFNATILGYHGHRKMRYAGIQYTSHCYRVH